jgi:hypothetical protein
MKKRHMSMCALFSCVLLQGYVFATISDNFIHLQGESRDAKTSHILANVGRVVEGLIKVIKDPHNKPNVLLHVGDMLSGIFSIAAHSLPNHELTQEDVAELRSLLQDVAQSIIPLLQQNVLASATNLHAYLQTVPLESLSDATLNNSESIESENNQLNSSTDVYGDSNNDESAINDSDSQTDNNQDNSSIDNLYNIVIDENEKELHINLLNALNSLVESLFAIVQSPGNSRVVEQSIADMFSNIINVASQTLKYEYLSSQDAEESVVNYLESFSDELTQEIKHLMLQTALHLRGSRACGSCNNCCSNSCYSSSCGSTICKPCCRPCNNCCRNMTVKNQLKGCCNCSSCDNTSNNSCSHCGCKNTMRFQVTLRKCSSCSCSNNSGTCNTCGCKTVPRKTVMKYFRSGNNHPTFSTEDYLKCGCNKPKPQQDESRNVKCNCNKPRPQQTTSRDLKCGCNKPRPSTRDIKCGCNKPKPQQEVTRNDNICSKCGCFNKPNRPGQEARCGCNKPKPQ